jgi:hypothetical protein
MSNELIAQLELAVKYVAVVGVTVAAVWQWVKQVVPAMPTKVSMIVPRVLGLVLCALVLWQGGFEWLIVVLGSIIASFAPTAVYDVGKLLRVSVVEAAERAAKKKR